MKKYKQNLLKSKDSQDLFYINLLREFEDEWFKIMEEHEKNVNTMQLELHRLTFDFSTRLLKENYA